MTRLHFESLPFVAGSDTSYAAALQARNSASTDAQRIFVEIAARRTEGMTCDQVEQELDFRHQTASARIRQLSQRHWIRDSGRRRATRAGRSAVVWVATRPEERLSEPDVTPTGPARFYLVITGEEPLGMSLEGPFASTDARDQRVREGLLDGSLSLDGILSLTIERNGMPRLRRYRRRVKKCSTH